MEVQEYIDKVESSNVYKEWSAENSDFYLVHLFSMTGQVPQVGYYSEKEDKITTFVVDSEVTKNPAEESFKEQKIIPPLELNAVSIDLPEAIKVAKEVNEKEYSKDNIEKQLMILQTIDNIPTYNVTLITSTFHYVNVKIDAASGDVVSHSKNSILDLKKE